MKAERDIDGRLGEIVSSAFSRVEDVTAELGAPVRPAETRLRQVTWELGLLTALILALVASGVILRRNAPPRSDTR